MSNILLVEEASVAAQAKANKLAALTVGEVWTTCCRKRRPGTSGRGARVWCMRPCCMDFSNLIGHEVDVCGSVKMAESAVPAFLAQGLSEGACFSDAFLPLRPRPTVNLPSK